MRKAIYLFVVFISLACTERKAAIKNDNFTQDTWEKLSLKEQVKRMKESTTGDSVLSNDIDYINDSILQGKFKLNISKYELENVKNKCYPVRLSKKVIQEFYDQGFNNLGDLNGDGKDDSVFVLNALSYCDDGDSYYFTNNKIPRILSKSYCCHPESIFSIGDIDEDGCNEIAEYHSSCVSNFKGIHIRTLKNNKWILIASFVFFYNNGKYEAFKDFNKLYKKIAKNKFIFLEISDMRADGEVVMEWKTVTMQ